MFHHECFCQPSASRHTSTHPPPKISHRQWPHWPDCVSIHLAFHSHTRLILDTLQSKLQTSIRQSLLNNSLYEQQLQIRIYLFQLWGRIYILSCNTSEVSSSWVLTTASDSAIVPSIPPRLIDDWLIHWCYRSQWGSDKHCCMWGFWPHFTMYPQGIWELRSSWKHKTPSGCAIRHSSCCVKGSQCSAVGSGEPSCALTGEHVLLK